MSSKLEELSNFRFLLLEEKQNSYSRAIYFASEIQKKMKDYFKCNSGNVFFLNSKNQSCLPSKSARFGSDEIFRFRIFLDLEENMKGDQNPGFTHLNTIKFPSGVILNFGIKPESSKSFEVILMLASSTEVGNSRIHLCIESDCQWDHFLDLCFRECMNLLHYSIMEKGLDDSAKSLKNTEFGFSV